MLSVTLLRYCLINSRILILTPFLFRPIISLRKRDPAPMPPWYPCEPACLSAIRRMPDSGKQQSRQMLSAFFPFGPAGCIRIGSAAHFIFLSGRMLIYRGIEVVIYDGKHCDNLVGCFVWRDWSWVFHLRKKAAESGPVHLRGGAFCISLFHLKRVSSCDHRVLYCGFALFCTVMNSSNVLEGQNDGRG